MKWRIAIPLVVALCAVGYILYDTISSRPTAQVRSTLPVALQHFGDCLVARGNGEALLKHCSRPCVEQCEKLLEEIAIRERRNPGFRFTSFSVKAVVGGGARQSATIRLIDNKRTIFYILDCQCLKMPDGSWKITDVAWRPFAEL